MGSKLNKVLTVLGILLGGGGFVLGMLATFNPKLVDKIVAPANAFMNSPAVSSWIDKYLILVVFGFFALVFGLAFSPLWLGYFEKRKKMARLKIVGVKGTGRILSVQDTGITVNNSPYVKIALEVEQTHTRAEFTTMVGRVSFPRVGDTLDIVYDPSDPSVVMPASQMS